MVETKERFDTPITFRKATVKDAHLIACIDEAAHPPVSESNQLLNTAMINDLLEEYERSGENHSFIAYREGMPVGYMLMTAHHSLEGKEYRIVSWSVIHKQRSFQTASAMVKYALAIGGGHSLYRAWAREKTVAQRILKAGIRDWFEKQGYEVYVDEDSRKDSGGETHVDVRLTPIPSSDPLRRCAFERNRTSITPSEAGHSIH